MGKTEENAVTLLVFQSSGLACAFPLDAVQKIVPMALLSCPPGLPSGLAGFLNLRGIAVPILRLDRLFDLPEQQPGLYTPFIILRGAPSPIGVLVGAVRQVASTRVASFLPLPEKHLFHDCATAVVDVDGDPVHLLAPECMLVENERRLVADLQSAAQRRLRSLEEKN
jgi:purine-binding chemotaxis protein CheW